MGAGPGRWRRTEPAAARTTRRAWLSGAGAGMLAVGGTALAACGRAAEERPAARVQEPVTLRYLASFEPSTATTFPGALSQLVETWNAKQTPIQVQPINPTGNRNQAALAMIAAGDPPDLFHALPRDYHPFANGGALLELDPLLRKDRQVAPDVIPTILEYWAREGKHYAMPNNWSPQAIYFNRSLFEKHGLKSPD